MQPEASPDIDWVAELSGREVSPSARAVEEAGADRRLFRHLEREHRRGGRASYIEIDAPLELYALTRLLRPQHILEVGVSSGVSSAYLLDALDRNGRGTLHSVDLPSRPRRPNGGTTASWSLPPGETSGWAVPRRLRRRWDLRLGDKADLVPLLADELPRIDLVLYDVPHDDEDLPKEFRALDRRMPTGAVAIVDHGPSGGLCPALANWARRRRSRAVGRTGLGLYAMRCGGRNRPRGAESEGRKARPNGGGAGSRGTS
jgi:hypothetical protein